jgi:hypothetical protein
MPPSSLCVYLYFNEIEQIYHGESDEAFIKWGPITMDIEFTNN